MVKFFIEIGFEGSIKRVCLIEEQEKIKKIQKEKKEKCGEWQV